MRYLLFLLLASCCSVAPSQTVASTPAASVTFMADGGCLTKCGMVSPYGKDCRGLQAAEDRILRAYARNVKGWSYSRTCQAVSGVTVYVIAGTTDGEWVLPADTDSLTPEPYHILGMTFLTDQAILLGTGTWNDSALAHELGHILRWKMNRVFGGHEQWTELGLCAAINDSGRLKCDPAAPGFSTLKR